MTPEEFADRLRRAQHDDEVAFAALFRDTQPVLLRYLRTLAAGAADDIASETWIAVVRGLDRFVGDDVGAFRAWVLSIARRRWIDEVRRRARRPELPTAALPEQAARDDVSGEVSNRLDTAVAMRLVAALPPDQVEVVFLRVVVGLDVQRTAELVGKTPGAVRVLSHRGLRRLAQLLQPAVTVSGPPTVER